HGIEPGGEVHWQPTTSFLVSQALLRGDAQLAEGGAVVVDTGRHTGRSPRDRFVVRTSASEDRIGWGPVNQPLGEEHFEGLGDKVVSSLAQRDLYVVDAFAGADPAHRLSVRIVTASPWHALFAKTLFIDPRPGETDDFQPDALVLHAPEVEALPDEDGTRSGT